MIDDYIGARVLSYKIGGYSDDCYAFDIEVELSDLSKKVASISELFGSEYEPVEVAVKEANYTSSADYENRSWLTTVTFSNEVYILEGHVSEEEDEPHKITIGPKQES